MLKNVLMGFFPLRRTNMIHTNDLTHLYTHHLTLFLLPQPEYISRKTPHKMRIEKGNAMGSVPLLDISLINL